MKKHLKDNSLDRLAECHWLWLSEQIKEIRTYSGTKSDFHLDSALIVDVHIDSLEMLELINAIEQYTKVPIQDEIWMKWHYLRDIVVYLTNTILEAS